ncbi:hypothetical protein SEUCBS140593_005774 [Sporothrix eucalyptigena]|uniref:Uncharacterized protein n=1 Tax=Sporothrix eucalyptigena TaxID=1812306 RepID=A0ABP0BZ84_9PEZI
MAARTSNTPTPVGGPAFGLRHPRGSIASQASRPQTRPAARQVPDIDDLSCCYVCCEPCVSSIDGIVTREDAHAIICRFTVNGVRVPPGSPYTSVVRGTHYARPSAFECPECSSYVCCLCMYRCLLGGIKHVGNHAISCTCGKVPLINKQTVLFLTPEQFQEHQLYLRCDEWCCPDPLYCPIPTCSAYIPTLDCLRPGAYDNDASVRQGPQVNCVQCQMPICTQCKGRADDLAHSQPEIPCKRPNVHGTEELEQLMRKSGFRQCSNAQGTDDESMKVE